MHVHYDFVVVTRRYKSQIARRFSQPLVISTANDAQDGPRKYRSGMDYRHGWCMVSKT